MKPSTGSRRTKKVADVVTCLACGEAPRLLDTQVEMSTPWKTVRRRLVECRKCGTVRVYRTISETEDLGDHEKRYLRADSRAR